MKKTLLISLSALLLVVVVFVVTKQMSFFKNRTNQPAVASKAKIKANVPAPGKQSAPEETSKQPDPAEIKAIGIYTTAWVAGSTKRMDELIQFIKDTKMNSIVIDIKDDTGMLSYPSTVPLAQEIGATSKRIPNLKELVARLKKENIYTIARQVVFKDPLFATKHTEIAVRDKNGSFWRDRKGMIWVDPHSEKVWKYNLDIAKEAIAMGFSEIQFDYVRFLSDGKISNAVYPFSKGELKEDVIRNFLLYTKKDINALGVPLSADIFGLVLTFPHDNNIGQKLEKIAEGVDIICPMVYPSHYPKGTFDIKVPDLKPYEVIDFAMKDGIKRVPLSKVKYRPWIQDFDLGSSYGRDQIQAQIKALKDNGIEEYLIWNPRNRYDASKY
ncbi:MAG TPA: putative glycoside hydrolase [Bacillota bacterium]|nr:putative glycoside hydrolase [Bacillota bacterium]